MNCKEILEYTQNNYQDVHDLIGRSLVNFYSLRLKIDKNQNEEKLQEVLWGEINILFIILSKNISLAVSISDELIYDKLKEIYIKS